MGMEHLADQIFQLATSVSKLDNQNGKLPAQSELDVRKVSALTMVSSLDPPRLMTEEEFNEVFGFTDKSDKKDVEPQH